MMTEIWWKVFLGGVITVIAAKLLGCKQGIFLLFSISFIGWAIGLFLFVFISGKIWELRKDGRKGSERGCDDKG